MPLLGAALAVLVGGCNTADPTGPYVYRWDEFNRELPTFNKPQPEWEPVSICYNGLGTTDLDVQRMAEAECAKFGRAAEPIDNRFGRCPLLAPNEAVFRCNVVVTR